MAFIKTPEEIIHREMNPAWTGKGYDFSKLYKPREETIVEDGNSLQNKSYVDSFLEGRKEKPKEKTYVLKRIVDQDDSIDQHELDQIEKEIEEFISGLGI